MDKTAKKIFECGIIPVIKLVDASDAVPLCDALLNAGIDVAEITFRTNAAAESIRRVVESIPGIFIGAGTVTSIELVKKAVEAGANFIVSPGFNLRVVSYCVERDIPIFPGISCPSDIENGLSYGLEVLKFFPAEAAGGLKMLKAMAAPYGSVKFMPTGGIDASNVSSYFEFDRVIACGGSWMVNDSLIKNKKFDEVTKLSREAVMKMHNFQFAHLGVNTDAQKDAQSIAQMMNTIFGLASRDTGASVFAGPFLEIMYQKGASDMGHIGFTVNHMGRAIAYLEKVGMEIDYDTMRGDKDNPSFVYLKQRVGGFAVHITR